MTGTPAIARRLQRRLTIGMATYDDYDGVYFTIQALRMYHHEVMEFAELVVIDNHPDGACANSLRALENAIDNFRYIPNTEVSGTAVRDKLFSEAAGEFVLCIDCHVLLIPNSLSRLLAYFNAYPETPDLLQGPLLFDGLNRIATHFKPQWCAGMYGTWAYDERGRNPNGEPFDIPMQGLGLFACRKSAWPGFNPKFRGFGGEEGYIHEKFRQRGARTLCLPFLRWLHRFNRPLGVPYRITWDDRFRNYIIGFRELQQPFDELLAHMTELLGPVESKRLLSEFEKELGYIPVSNETLLHND
jgi:hypothetical protein